jgi:chemosensory pili system protein ChpC
MANTAEHVSKDQDVVRSFVVPLAGIHLLVPNIAVAEVVAYREPMPMPNAAPWMAGMVQWRGLQIPLLTFEVFAGLASAPPAQARRLVIFNTLRGNAKLPFIAVASQGIPRSVRVSQGSVQQAAPAAEPGLACRLGVGEVSLAIPDIDAMEDALAQGGVVVVRDSGN